MVRFFCSFIVLISFSSLSIAQEIANDRVVVQFDKHINLNEFKIKLNTSHTNIPEIKQLKYIIKDENLAVAILAKSQTDIRKTIKDFGHLDVIIYSTQDEFITYRDEPNDSLRGDLWNMDLIQANDAWNITTGGHTSNGDEIVVAVIDSGFEYCHEDLQDNIWTNKGEIPNDGIDNDNNGYIDDYYGLNVQTGTDDLELDYHGTKVLGVLGGKGNNSKGVVGINWNIKMMLITGAHMKSEIIEAYEYVKNQRILYNETNGEQGDFVVATNSSWGIPNVFPESFPFWCMEYDRMGEAGILSAASTVNLGVDVEINGDMPSLCTSEYLITTTSVDQFDDKVSSHGYNSVHVDLAAPGQGTTSTNWQNSYSDFSGTSAACPHISGAIALMYSINCPDFTPSFTSNPSGTAQLIRNSILDNVDPNSTLEGITVTGGRLNVYNALLGLEASCGEPLLGSLQFNKIFPNPNLESDIINFEFITNTATPHQIFVFNTIGQIVHEKVHHALYFGNNNFQLNVRDWAQGIYFVHLSNQRDQIIEKIIVR